MKDVIGRNEEFRGNNQNDSQEFISYLIDTIHEETKSKFIKTEDIAPLYNYNEKDVEQILEYKSIRSKCLTIIKSSNTTTDEKREANYVYNMYKKEHEKEECTLNALIHWNNFIKNNYSIITELFTGMFCTTFKPECGNISRKFETFTLLSIETPKADNTTLEKCLKDFSSDEILDKDDMYHCSHCNKKEKTQINIYIWKSPEILIMHLKRFENEYISQQYSRQSKTNSVIKFPLEGLSLRDNHTTHNVDDALYNLVSIILHMGTCTAGHYKAYCKNPINNEWYEHNDETIVHIPINEIENDIVTKDAYVLVYQKDHM